MVSPDSRPWIFRVGHFPTGRKQENTTLSGNILGSKYVAEKNALQNTELTIGITEKTMGSVGDGSQAELAAHSWGEDRSVETQWQKKKIKMMMMMIIIILITMITPLLYGYSYY